MLLSGSFSAARAFSLMLACLLALACPRANANAYLAALIETARARALHDAPQWQALMHYKKRFGFLGVRSLADDARYFNSATGKTDPRAELEATLAAFFSDEQESDSTQNPQCRFIARYQWLKNELQFDPQRLPEQPCARFHQWREQLDPGSITLVFASAYLNNPSSAYGHTLLRIDRKEQQDNTSLLAYAVSYAARADDANALVFGVKGLLGGYDGTYAMSPYYVKVAEYNDFENRDLWEYELALSPQEIDLILMHVWELGPIAFDYFFFDENCAYQLLLLLDVARPSLKLSDRFPLWAIPADTVRAVMDAPGLVQRATYRPSRSTTLRARTRGLQSSEIDQSLRLAEGTLPPAQYVGTAPATRAAPVLELAHEYLEYRRERGEAKGVEVGERLRGLLSARSKVDQPSDLSVPTPHVRPDQGHRSTRVGFALGTLEGHGFQELRVRPAYHDLMDPQEGYLPGSQIDFFNVVLRRDNRRDQIELEQFDLARVTSLAARDPLIKPLSWSARFGVDRLRAAGDVDGLRARMSVLGGYTYQTGNCCLWNAMLGVDFQGSRRLEGAYALGPGAELAAYADLSTRWRVGAVGRVFRYVAGDTHTAREIKLETRFTLSPRLALKLEASEQNEYGARSTTLGISLSLYL